MSGEILLVNPRRRRKSKKSRARRHTARRSRRVSRVRARRNPRARKRSFRRIRARRNPVSLSVGGAMGTLKAGAFGAVGGILNDLVIGYGKSYLPAVLASGYGLMATKLASAVLVGYGSDKLMKGRGKDFAVGAATVVLHEAFKAQIASMAPTLPLGEYLDTFGNNSNQSLLGYNPGQIVDGVSDYEDTGDMGEYMTGVMGEYNDEAF